MEIVNSISDIIEVKNTQRKPVVVLCENLERFICKHAFGKPPNLLFNEYIASRFLQMWDIPSLEPWLVNINPSQIPNHFVPMLRSEEFLMPCIGYKYLSPCIEISQLHAGIKNMPNDKRKIKNSDDLLTIAIFDLWVANEDRHELHYNLLLSENQEMYEIVPIDHEFIFNSNCLTKDRPLAILSENESLLSSDVFKTFLGKQKRNKILSEWDNYKNMVYLRIEKCKSSLESILSELPLEWNINIDEKKELLLSTIFSNEWCNDVMLYSQSYLKQ